MLIDVSKSMTIRDNWVDQRRKADLIRALGGNAQAANTDRYAALFRHLLGRGIYFPPSQFEALFVSLAHRDDEIQSTVQALADFDD